MSDNGATKAKKAKIYILDKLREEWELAPKENYSDMGSVSGYTVKAGIIIVPRERFMQWAIECGIDYRQLRNILAEFESKGLINQIRSIGEYE